MQTQKNFVLLFLHPRRAFFPFWRSLYDNALRHKQIKLKFLQKFVKMTENLKSIVQAVNKCLKTDFNLISFDSQSEESLLQVLLDVFQKFEIINGKVRNFWII